MTAGAKGQSLPSGVPRKIKDLIKAILFILPTNGAEALIVISSMLILFEVMPIIPYKIGNGVRFDASDIR